MQRSSAGLLAGFAAASLTGPASATPAGPSPSVAASDGLLTTVRARRHRMRRGARMLGGSRFNNVTRGAIGGDSGGNAVTGSTAAPSGR
ncbi:hypothetical protein GOFOIKOB_5059 [Methylobacterium tardum]|uniref:Uncharacterized protein n=1 Tax=Methylobacterium tardum TaxID=374432 RepID=A0AA37WTD8_9HYPH|nr:hypothetical protein [Methylobacterium tardum]URD35971.1 hypothetical protein M6G65_26600 [Methylobacterium tardum]GJE51994.1 hypothetical protein GOFOIKOB_5059 [Methylobacterium tardum]GLS72146.1 hypothetical protein GCM10007890_41590 [Methylobacterium tardum]